MRTPVVHLHNHTTHSVRDGLQRLDRMCEAARADFDAVGHPGAPAVAVTDHGNLSASWRFAEAAAAAGVKPIMGIEAYLAHGSRTERLTAPAASADAGSGSDGEGKEARYHHLTLLAADREGFGNLLLLSDAANASDAFWSKPRMDFELLAEHHRGLVVLTGCLGGPVLGPLAAGDEDRARSNLATLVDILGSDACADPERSRLFIEVMDHDIPLERATRSKLLELARSFALPVVATNDAHYTRSDEAAAHDAWLCVGSDARLDDPGRWRFTGSGYHLRSTDEMRAIFDGSEPTAAAVDNTWRIAERVEADVLPEAHLRLPRFRLPDGAEPPGGSAKYLAALVAEGAKARYGDPLAQVVRERLNFEYRVVRSAGLADYFLIVADMIAWARSEGIRVGPGRGSSAGSALSYCLGIVDVDPIAHNLLFERFLNPERVGMPDIDTDFEQGGVPRVIAYLRRRWGDDRVARIGSFGVLGPPGAIRTAGKILDAATLAGRLAEKVPSGSGGKPVPFSVLDDPEAGEAEPFRREAGEQGAAELLDLARSFEGQVNAEGIHACGVVVSDEPLPGLVPLRRDRREGHEVAVTEWDGKDVDALGLLKLDVLGLRNLDVVSETVRLVLAATGEDISALAARPPTDPVADPRAARAWSLIAEGRTAGVFQLESGGMTELAQRVAPTSLDELSAVIALFRPGPLGDHMHDRFAERKAGSEPVDYGIFTSEPLEAEAIAAVLGETFGVPVYQEQLMRLGEVVGGFGPGMRERLRKAVSKKIRSEMDAVGEAFLAGAQRPETDAGEPKPTFSEATANKLWDAMKGAGSYAFNKSHSLGYASVAYLTAFLKANWPAPFGAALLSVTDDDDRRVALLRSLRDDGITVVLPDLNLSGVSTTLDQSGSVRLGLGEIKGVGSNAAAIVSERDAHGRFVDLSDLARRVRVTEDGKEPRPIPSNILEALVEAGALDSFGPRKSLASQVRSARHQPAPSSSQESAPEWPPVERAARERARLGALVSDSPLRALSPHLRHWHGPASRAKPRPVSELPKAGCYASVIGMVARWTVVRKGRRRAYLTVEGSGDSVDAIVWSELLDRLEANRTAPRLGEIVGVDGKVREFTVRLRRTGADGDVDEDVLADLGDETVSVTRKELVVYDIWRGELPAEADRPAPPPVPVPDRPSEPSEPPAETRNATAAA